MKFLCTYIEEKASEAGMDTSNRSFGNIRRMFEGVGNILGDSSANARKGQLKWRTVVLNIRKKLKSEKERIGAEVT